MNNPFPADVLLGMRRTFGWSLLRPLLLAASVLPLAGCLTYDEFGSYGAVSSYGYGYEPVYVSGYPYYHRSYYRSPSYYRPYSSFRGGWWSGSRSVYHAPDHRPRYDSFHQMRDFKKSGGSKMRVMNLDRHDNRGGPVVIHSRPKSGGSNKVIKMQGSPSRAKVQPAFVTRAAAGGMVPKHR